MGARSITQQVKIDPKTAEIASYAIQQRSWFLGGDFRRRRSLSGQGNKVGSSFFIKGETFY
jgi:hypothetical protein